MVNGILHGIYKAFFNNKPFKELKVTSFPDFEIYEVWFNDPSMAYKKKQASFSHCIVIQK